MSHFGDAWFHRLKAAQRDLIKMAGGIERTAELTSFSKSEVGRWNLAGEGQLMPLAAVFALEMEVGVPIVTSAMAGLQGRRLSDPAEDEARVGDVLARFSDAARQSADLTAAGALALADGKITPAEASEIDRAASRLQQSIVDLRNALAGTKAAGGFSVVDGGRANG
ncbi:phage regulatory CII family protein [Mesorhizobium xinjiangense]|uniref:phage regulatory CII family protein n=1 Tax=Mesorhizobium xinjiangense TaxID=2678685 RepID=UPI0012EEB463|nr:phage regulatory CII family protein [Mesorhizobium xinjiangense]